MMLVIRLCFSGFAVSVELRNSRDQYLIQNEIQGLF